VKRDLAWILAALVLGLVLLPPLVHVVGNETLGAYANGGMAAFQRDFYADLLRFRPAAWTLAAGPAVLALIWRAMLRGSRGTHSRDTTRENATPR
jgi:hypothetical protein